METIKIDNDINLMYVAASSFPNGVMAAHQKLHAIIPFSTARKYYGISRPENGTIQYKAAAEELQNGEAATFGLATIVMKKGNYLCIAIHDYMKDHQGIGRAFTELIAQQGIDPQGYCVEWYESKEDVKCMVRLAE